MSNIEMILVSNAGILIKYECIKILIDGIYIDETGFFSQVPEKVIKQYKSGKGCFGNIDYILFTHNHQDHFSMKALQIYLKYNTPKLVFLPCITTDESENLKKKFEMKNIKFIESLKIKQHKKYIIEQNIMIDVYKTTHCGEEFKDICNLCYLITINDKSILFTGDADMNESNFWFINKFKNVNILIINGVFFQSNEGKKLIKELINPDEIIVCHIPFQEDDKNSWRKYILRAKKHYKGYLSKITLLMEKDQNIFL